MAIAFVWNTIKYHTHIGVFNLSLHALFNCLTNWTCTAKPNKSLIAQSSSKNIAKHCQNMTSVSSSSMCDQLTLLNLSTHRSLLSTSLLPEL